MNIIGKFISNFKDFYNEINTATLTGAIDVVVVRQEDGSYLSSPFHVRFGKMGVLRSREKVVDIEINGEPVDIHMKLGETGEAFFVQDLDDDVDDEAITDQNYAKSDEEARSQDSGFEAEDNINESQQPPPPSSSSSKPLTLRLETEGSHETRSDVWMSVASNFSEECDISASRNETSSVAAPVGDVKDDSNTFEGEVRSTLSSELGVISRVPRQNSSKFSLKHICTQTDSDEVDILGAKKVTPKRADGEKGLSSSFESSPRQKNGKKSTAETSGKNGGKNDSDSKSKDDADDNSKGSRSQRRKRRRRQNHKQATQQGGPAAPSGGGPASGSGGKKKGGSGSQSSDASTTSEVADLASVGNGDANAFSAGLRDSKVDHELDTTTPIRKISCAEFGPNFHPFSDTDISPPPSPGGSRPGTPIKSDTEYEVERQRQELSDQCATSCSGDTWNWTWGQLPTPPAKVSAKGGSVSSTASTSATSSPTTVASSSSVNCSSAEQRTETTSAASETAAGVLQDSPDAADTSSADLAPADPNLGEAQRSMFGGMLSFMRATKKARHNPQSEGIYLEDLNPEELDPEVAALYFPKFNPSVGETQSVKIPGSEEKREDDAESGNGPSLPNSPQSCGDAGLLGLDVGSDPQSGGHPVFDYKGYEDVALSLCGQLQELRSGEVPESLFLQSEVSYDDFCSSPSALLASPDLVVRLGGAYYNWAAAAPQLMALVLYRRPLPQTLTEELTEALLPKKEDRKRSPSMGLSWFGWRRTAPETGGRGASATTPTAAQPKPSCPDTVEVTAAQTQTSAPGSPEKAPYDEGRSAPSGGNGARLSPKHGRNYKRSLRLTSEQIEKLKLHDGGNEVQFSVTTAYQGTTRCTCRIYLWNYDEKIIVSDIDGTITKSDVLGHILPIIGRDWAQGGVAQLFSKIKDNGYHFLYLSARAIGQARITRDYLESVVQEDVTLPDGPLLLNPTSLLQAFHREVIERKPEEFKISCLRDIQALFPKTGNPFYAGYGNRVNDVWAYCAVGIPISRVFTINHKGELKHELTQTFQSTYSNLSDIVHHMFPVYCQETLHHGEYSSVRYWRQPLPDCEDEINRLLGSGGTAARA